MTQQAERAADVAAGISIPAAVTAWAASALPILQLVATVVGQWQAASA